MKRPDIHGADAQRILGLLGSTLEMYRITGARGDALYGQALAHILFTLNQQVKPVGILGTLTGKVARFKDHALLEMFLLTRVREEDIPAAFVLYAKWRLGSGEGLDLGWLKSVLAEALARLPREQRASLHRDARQQRLAWLSLIDEAAWDAPHDAKPLTLDGVLL